MPMNMPKLFSIIPHVAMNNGLHIYKIEIRIGSLEPYWSGSSLSKARILLTLKVGFPQPR